MRIREIRVEGFGALRDRTIELEGPVSIFYGPNEAGKSTLLHLIRAVLFGFPPRGQAAERFEPPGGGAHGGALLLETAAGERVRIARRSAEAAGGRGRSPSAGVLSVTLPDGVLGGEEFLQELLGGVTGEQFRNLFAFTLTELQELRTLTTEELGGFLHSAGLGVRASAVTGAEKRLAQELDARFRPRGRSQGIGRLLAESEALEAAWRRSLGAAGRYNHLAEEIARVTERIAEAEEELRQTRRRLSFLQSAASLSGHWHRRRTVRQELQQLPGRAGFPEEGLKRQEELLLALERSEERMARLTARQEELEQAAAAFTDGDSALVTVKIRLGALLEASGLYRAGFREEAELDRELGQLQEELRQRLLETGIESLQDAKELPPVMLSHREEALRWKERWEDYVRSRRRLEADLENTALGRREAQDTAAERQSQLEQAVRRLEEKHSPRAEQLASELPGVIRELRRDLQLAAGALLELRHAEERELERRLQLEQLQAQAGAAAGAGYGGAKGPSGARMLAGMLACGLGAGTALFFGLRAEWLWSAVSLVLCGGLGIMLLWRGAGEGAGKGSRSSRSSRPWSPSPEPRQAEASSPLHQKREELERELMSHRGRISARLERLKPELDRAAGFGGKLRELVDRQAESLPDQLELWLTELIDDLREKERLADKRKEALQALSALDRQEERLMEQLRQLEENHAVLLGEWKGWLRRWGTGGLGITPGFAPELLVRLEQAKELLGRSQAASARMARIREERSAYEAEAFGLLGVSSMEPDGLGSALQAFKASVEEAAARLNRKQEAEAELEALLPERNREVEGAARVRARLEALWKQAEAQDEEEFRRYGAERQLWLKLQEELSSLDEVLAAGVGTELQGQLDELLNRQGEAGLAEELARTEEALRNLAASLDLWKEEKGRLASDYGKLLNGHEHGELQDKREELLARFGEEAEQWAVYAMAAGLLKRAKSVYERDRQPAVLQRASEHFSRLTNGRYARIVAPVGEEKLYALRPGGEALESSRLSRGTAEQMYLSLRFALAHEFAKRTPLPIIMDDIFVNFDGDRLRATAGELAKLAVSHQILVFTCHRHVLEAVQEANPSAQAVFLG